MQQIETFDKELKSQIITLSSQYFKLQNEKLKGTISYEKFTIKYNRINEDLLLLIDRFPDGSTLLEYKLFTSSLNLNPIKNLSSC